MHEAKKILERIKKAEGKKELWRDIYQECYEYALPQRNLYDGYYDGGTPGQRKMSKVFDSTAINSTQKFANRIQSVCSSLQKVVKFNQVTNTRRRASETN